MSNKWIDVKKQLPKDDKQLVVFIEWHQKWETVISCFCGIWEEVRNFREHQLTNRYTHWMPLPEPPKK